MGKNYDNNSNVNVNSISRISAGTVIKGNIKSPCDIRIDGEFIGQIMSEGRVVIGESAVIKGNIICQTVDLFGHVEGDIYANDTLALKSGCAVKGNLHINKLYVEMGAEFNGNCSMISSEEFTQVTGALLQSDEDAE